MTLLAMMSLLVASVRGALGARGAARDVLRRASFRQILFTGIEAIPVVGLLAATVGVLVIVQSATSLPDIGQAEFMGRLLVLLIGKELGPVLVAFVVASRSGAAIAAELSTMKVRGEIEGLVGVGVDPLAFLVFPRVLGVAVAVASLTVVFNVVAFFAGFSFAAISRESLTLVGLFTTLFHALTLGDIATFVLKSLLYGTAIAAICAHYGLSAGASSTDVPRVTLRAVVAALVACVVVEVVVTALTIDVGALIG
ncbi:MAG: ABC transporter permease [Deltaproteobacteria bacterium]|nr:ABC transporter permease [Deltaproteobacteria bacterium]